MLQLCILPDKAKRHLSKPIKRISPKFFLKTKGVDFAVPK